MAVLPKRQVGISYRMPLHEFMTNNLPKLDCVEVVLEDLLSFPDLIDTFRDISFTLPIYVHGIGLSLGSPELPTDAELSEVRDVVTAVRCSLFSEHIAYTRASGISLPAFTPTLFTKDSAENIRASALRLSDYLSVPVALENITYSFVPPESQLTELEFLNYIFRDGQLSMLLDITNAYINAVNHQFDPYTFLSGLPLQYLGQIHLSGTKSTYNGYIMDSHDAPIPEEVWNLLQFITNLSDIPPIIIEREANFTQIDDILLDVQKAREIRHV